MGGAEDEVSVGGWWGEGSVGEVFGLDVAGGVGIAGGWGGAWGRGGRGGGLQGEEEKGEGLEHGVPVGCFYRG